MATEAPYDYVELANALDCAEWPRVLDGVDSSAEWIQAAPLNDPKSETLLSKLRDLARHPKWEVRRAVANVAGRLVYAEFEAPLALLATDDNARVREAAEHASLRRRNWRQAGALGKQHEDRINSTLDSIEARVGVLGRNAVKHAAELIADIFARELYHEVIKLLSPLAMSADRLRTHLSEHGAAQPRLLNEAARIERQVLQIRAVLDAMRAYTAQPDIPFATEVLKDVVEEAASLVFPHDAKGARVSVDINIADTILVEIARPRLIQALTNVLTNAVESYDVNGSRNPIVVRAENQDGRVTLSIEDSGCGMTKEVLADASALFATSKPNGTGFGLPLAIKIVESEHGGRLTIQSTKDVGTVVRFVLPSQQRSDVT